VQDFHLQLWLSTGRESAKTGECLDSHDQDDFWGLGKGSSLKSCLLWETLASCLGLLDWTFCTLFAHNCNQFGYSWIESILSAIIETATSWCSFEQVGAMVTKFGITKWMWVSNAIVLFIRIGSWPNWWSDRDSDRLLPVFVWLTFEHTQSSYPRVVFGWYEGSICLALKFGIKLVLVWSPRLIFTWRGAGICYTPGIKIYYKTGMKLL